MAISQGPETDFVHLLCSWVSEGELSYLEGLGLSYEDIKMFKIISKRASACPKIRTRIFEGIIINKEAISELAKDAELGDLLVEIVINGASYDMAKFGLFHSFGHQGYNWTARKLLWVSGVFLRGY